MDDREFTMKMNEFFRVLNEYLPQANFRIVSIHPADLRDMVPRGSSTIRFFRSTFPTSGIGEPMNQQHTITSYEPVISPTVPIGKIMIMLEL